MRQAPGVHLPSGSGENVRIKKFWKVKATTKQTYIWYDDYYDHLEDDTIWYVVKTELQG